MKNQSVGLYLREFFNIFALPLSFYSGLVLTRPTVFAFYLTKRCNSRCQMCDFWKNQKMSDELSYNEICSILTDLKQFGVKTISFSAEGEIFTRKDTIQILEFAKELGFVFGVNSNGLAINKELAAQIARLQPNSVVLSIDTTDPEQYASIRGVKNGLERVIAA
ncbi:MAG: radical SAM protein, partial [Desulfobulbaceae bacterium]|nr:radical SAM protein [Desulfobulbaceae bacterium]